MNLSVPASDVHESRRGGLSLYLSLSFTFTPDTWILVHSNVFPLQIRIPLYLESSLPPYSVHISSSSPSWGDASYVTWYGQEGPCNSDMRSSGFFGKYDMCSFDICLIIADDLFRSVDCDGDSFRIYNLWANMQQIHTIPFSAFYPL